jgi:citronellol/citronellal dehydrogenase
MIAHLASPAGDWVSGAVMTVDGGMDNYPGLWPPRALLDSAGSPVAEGRRA